MAGESQKVWAVYLTPQWAELRVGKKPTQVLSTTNCKVNGKLFTIRQTNIVGGRVLGTIPRWRLIDTPRGIRGAPTHYRPIVELKSKLASDVLDPKQRKAILGV